VATLQVSIIIVTHNSETVLGGCLQSLPAAARGLECEVIVVDNASAVDPSIQIAGCVPTAAVLRNARNRDSPPRAIRACTRLKDAMCFSSIPICALIRRLLSDCMLSFHVMCVPVSSAGG